MGGGKTFRGVPRNGIYRISATGIGRGEEGRRSGEPNRPCRLAPPLALGLLASRALSSTAANWSYPDGEIALMRVT